MARAPSLHRGSSRSSSVEALQGLARAMQQSLWLFDMDMMQRCHAKRGLCVISLPEEPLVVLHTALQPRVAASMAELLNGGAAGATRLPGCRPILRCRQLGKESCDAVLLLHTPCAAAASPRRRQAGLFYHAVATRSAVLLIEHRQAPWPNGPSTEN
jgi:hypothetical protein